jgi:hypothetical protein
MADGKGWLSPRRLRRGRDPSKSRITEPEGPHAASPTERMMRRYAAVTDQTLRAAAEAVAGHE